jgi:hypothetical protein
MEQASGAFTDEVVAGASAGAIVVTSTTIPVDGGEILVCALNFTVAGDTATLAGTQACPGQYGMTNTYSTGTLTRVDADHWSASTEFGVSGIDPSSGEQLVASVQFDASCARM